ncbi:MAG: hypothetical protein WCR33_04210 [Bacilli bacterium]
MTDKLIYMYKFAEDNNISISNYNFNNNKKSMCMNYDNNFHIAIDYNRIKTKSEEVCILAEEIAHYNVGIIPTNPSSNSYFNKLVRYRNEYRATKRAVESLLDPEVLKSVIDSGYITNTYELADMFNVTPEFMENALYVFGFSN